ncbi:haemoglobin type 1 [Elysia marginata]|uniref:Globin n=1 Tax=Elysia marginata TaxID=1093978 RepID=A0AAV4JIB1_9GAST|nr:haemoglobin type 1 [Elysia marginata]
MSDCPVTGLTYLEKRDLESSWRKLIGTTPREFKNAGINLVLWMFDNIPNMRGRFTKFQANNTRSNLVADEMFLAHTQSVILAIDSIIKMLDNPSKLKVKLQSLVKSHVGQTPPIGSEYFEPFAARFHVFLVAALGVPEDSDEVAAWTKFLYALCSLVKVEEDAQRKVAKATAQQGAPCCWIL